MDRRRVFRGDRLQTVRVSRGLSQAQLAELAGVGPNQVYRYENGAADPTSDVLVRLASELKVTTDYLLGLVERPSDRLTVEGLSAFERRLLDAYRRGDIAEIMRAALEEHK